jgi:hypothetical protein
MMQGIVHLNALVKEVVAVVIAGIEIDLPLPKLPNYRDPGMKFPSPKDRGIRGPRGIFRGGFGNIVIIIIDFCAVIVLALVLVLDALVIQFILNLIVLSVVGRLLVSEDEGLESFLGEGRDLIDVKSNDYQWDENQCRNSDCRIELEPYLE